MASGLASAPQVAAPAASGAARVPGTPLGGERPAPRREPRSTPRRAAARGQSGGATASEANVNVNLANRLQAVSLDEDMPQLAPNRPARLYCPVRSCAASDPTRNADWMSLSALRSHVDGHMLGITPGRVPQAWLDGHRLKACSDCGKTVTTTIANGMHRKCWAKVAAAAADTSADMEQAAPSSTPNVAVADSLPTIMDVCLRHVSTREFLEPELLASAEKELLQCISNAPPTFLQRSL